MARTARWSQVHADLRRRILSVRIAPGTPLSEAALAAEFGTSTTPIRDALGRLTVEGLVEADARGYVVAPLRIADLRHLSDLRFILERGVCELLVASRTDLQAARQANARILADNDPDETADANIAFHVAMAASTGNTELAAVLQQVLDRSARFFRLGLQRISGGEIHKSHERLLAALAERDLTAATDQLQVEVFSTRDRVAGLLLGGGTNTVESGGLR